MNCDWAIHREKVTGRAPITRMLHNGQTTGHARDFEPFRSLPVTLPVTFPRCSGLSNSSTTTRCGTNFASVCEWNIVGHLFVRGWIIIFMPFHVWMKAFIVLNGKEGIQLEFNYHDKNTSPHVSLRTCNVPVKSKLKHPPRAYPGHLMSFADREGGNLMA